MSATQTQNTRSTAPRGQVIDDLDREWTDLVNSGHFAEHTELWLERWPALRPYFRTDSRPASARLDRAQADEILGALLNEHAAGSYPAGRMVLTVLRVRMTYSPSIDSNAITTPLKIESSTAIVVQPATGVSTKKDRTR